MSFLVIHFDEPKNPCNPSPCGMNAICHERNGAGSCVCVEGYFGDPYSGCRPECVLNTDCPRDQVCTNNKCRDPCPGTCGINAECNVFNHVAMCSCLPGYTGNPQRSCHHVYCKIFSLYFLSVYLLHCKTSLNFGRSMQYSD